MNVVYWADNVSLNTGTIDEMTGCTDMMIATLKFLAPSDEKPVYYASVGGEEAALDLEGQFNVVDVEIEDARPRRDDCSLDGEGFQLVDHPSAVTDFYDHEQIKSIYEDEVKALVAKATGARRVVVFDHTHRADSQEKRGQLEVREPSAVVHNDYTDKSARQRIIDILPADEAEGLLGRRFAIVNVWRAISHPAVTSQLALSDASTLKPGDAVPTERRAKDRIGELMMATYNPDSRWAYFSDMQPGEALLLKAYDTATDGRARFSLHTAFDHPNPPAGAKPRESLETRTFAFF